ncbi:proline-rich protein 29 isoform X2 [Misgurnus anguillicaudatus]|uniref:proline-rich protein 29 isoform X2 n=1 Tax=Misgurnus anguillicaudatus TaxID=75329 RepID=UPI003CCF716E
MATHHTSLKRVSLNRVSIEVKTISWTDSHDKQNQLWPGDLPNIHILQQPSSTIFQQLPNTVTSPLSPVRAGHIREDLVELMMIQNAQMHQVIMNNMTMSVLNTFDYTNTPEHHTRFDMNLEEEADVYHHYYPSVPGLCYPDWVSQPLMQASPPLQQIIQNPSQHTKPVSTKYMDSKAVPPPPPPSATQTVGADVPPAPEFYAAERGQL